MKTNDYINGSGGFSIIEILIATTISSIMLIMLYTAYTSTIRHISRGSEVSEYYENASLAISKINRDISNTFYNRENKNIAFIGEDVGDMSKLNFVTVDHRDINLLGTIKKSSPYTDIHEVGYYLRASKRYTGEYELIRREELSYDEKPDEGGTENVILEGVVELKFEFKLRNDWVLKWDSKESNRVPDAVKTTLKIQHAKAGAQKRSDEEKSDEFIFISKLNMVR